MFLFLLLQPTCCCCYCYCNQHVVDVVVANNMLLLLLLQPTCFCCCFRCCCCYCCWCPFFLCINALECIVESRWTSIVETGDVKTVDTGTEKHSEKFENHGEKFDSGGEVSQSTQYTFIITIRRWWTRNVRNYWNQWS